jgi:hypothetical protein
VGQDHAIPDTALVAYVAATVRATDASGAAIALRWGGSRRQGEVIWVTVLAPRSTAITVRNAMLFDLYDDQVNIVQSKVGGKNDSRLYTKRSS